MAVVRKDMFNDGTVIMEYYPHKRIILRVAGFKVIVNKPYGTMVYGSKERTMISPSIQMSTNMTVTLSFDELKLIIKAVNKSIDILNNEKDGLIINKNFTLGQEIWAKDLPKDIIDIHESKDAQPTNTKSIPYKDIRNNVVYEDEKGRQWIYLGEGWLYEDGDLCNRCNGIGQPYSKYIYLRYDDLKGQKCQIYNRTLICERIECCMIDSYASKKRFIKEVKELGNQPINAVVDKNKTFRFVENKGKTIYKFGGI